MIQNSDAKWTYHGATDRALDRVPYRVWATERAVSALPRVVEITCGSGQSRIEIHVFF
jgi:hypothetical protein